jgi:predicted transcriptional regulator
MSQTLTIRLNDELSSWLEETASRTGLSQGQIVREQLEKAKTSKIDRPFMRLAGSIRGLPRDLSQRKGYSTKA